MSEFSEGDKVRCVNVKQCKHLEKDEVYTVDSVVKGATAVILNEEKRGGIGDWFWSSRLSVRQKVSLALRRYRQQVVTI